MLILNSMDYEKLLQQGMEQLPESAKTRERFNIPNVKGHLEGNKTIVANFKEISQTLRREPEHLVKFLLKELAAPGDVKPAGLILGRRVSSAQINEKVKKYAEIYIICPSCGKPDTKILKENGLNFLKCQACGNKEAVRA